MFLILSRIYDPWNIWWMIIWKQLRDILIDNFMRLFFGLINHSFLWWLWWLNIVLHLLYWLTQLFSISQGDSSNTLLWVCLHITWQRALWPCIENISYFLQLHFQVPYGLSFTLNNGLLPLKCSLCPSHELTSVQRTFIIGWGYGCVGGCGGAGGFIGTWLFLHERIFKYYIIFTRKGV